MKLPKSIEFTGIGYSLDGGSRTLYAVDQNEVSHEIELIQRGLILSFSRDRLPGRLYFDKKDVPVRSKMEFSIIELIQTGKLDPPDHAIEHYGGIEHIEAQHTNTKNKILDYVLSNEYVRFANWIDVMLFQDGLVAFEAVATIGMPKAIEIRLHVIQGSLQNDKKAWRLYLNGGLVPIRSNLEKEVLALIKADSTSPTIMKPITESDAFAQVEEAAKDFKSKVLEFVLSDTYVRLGLQNE